MRLPHLGEMFVDPALGSFRYWVRDLSIPCRGRTELEISRFYNSNLDHPHQGNFQGWTFSFDERLRFEYTGPNEELDALQAAQPYLDLHLLPGAGPLHLSAVSVLYPDGSHERFALQPGGGYAPANPRVRRTLTADPEGGWTLGVPNFGTHRFRQDGKLAARVDAYGNQVRFDWQQLPLGPGDGLPPMLARITDPVGRALEMSYSPAPDQEGADYTRTVRDWTGRTWSYVMDDGGHVLSHADPEGHVTRYHHAYVTTRSSYFPPPPGLAIPNLPGLEPPALDQAMIGLHRIEFPNGAFVTNYASGPRPSGKRVGVQILGTDLAIHHLYDEQARRTTKLVGTAERAWLYEFDANYALLRATDPLGNQHRYEYDDRGRVVATVDPGLARTTYEYDDRDNLTRITDSLGRSTRYEYDAALDLATRVLAPGPGETASTYGYHPVSGVLLEETDPLGARVGYDYDRHGQVRAVTDPLGHVTSFRYNARGDLSQRTDPLGQTTTFLTDELGRVVSVTSPTRGVTKLAYDHRDQVTSLTDPTGATWTFGYDAHRNLVRVQDPLRNQTRYEYDVLNRLVRTLDPKSQATELDYDAHGNLVGVLDALGRRTSFDYDLLDRLVRAVDAAGGVSRVEPAPYCGDTTTTDPLGRQSTVHRDVLCRVTQVDLPDGGVMKVAHDERDNLVSLTDPLGRTTRFEYDLAGRLVKVTDAQGRSETRSYDLKGNLSAATDRRGYTATFTYDAADRLSKLVRRDGAEVSFSYDGEGRLRSTTDGLGNTWRFSYDQAGRLGTATNPLGHNLVRNVYDAAGRLAEQVGALGGRTKYEYDEGGRLLAVTDPLGNRSTRTYDAAGNLRTLVDPLGRATHLAYDDLDRLVALVDPQGGVVRQVLDAVGNLVSVLDQNGNATYYEFDVMDRVKAEIYPDGTRLEWERDAVGNLVAQRDPRGFRTTFEYDALDRLTRIGYSDEEDATFRYDANGNLVERTDGTGSYTFEHDAEDRVVAFTQPGGSRYRVEYDGEGNRTVLVFPDGSRQGLEYDSAGRLATLVTPEGGRTAFTYDAQDRRTRIDRPNGTCTLYEYDEASRLSRLAHLESSGEKVTPDLRYSRDAVGNVLSITDAGTPLWTYGYDRLDRLVRAVDHPGSRTWEWGYDPVGNRLSESLDGTVTRSSYNELNQLVQRGQTRFWYDLAGNLAHRAGPDGVSTYRFDSRDRLVEVRTPQNQLVRYGYDAVGRLQTRKLDTDAKSTKFEWDGWDLAREVGPDGLETAYHLPQGEILSFKRGSSVYQVHADALGSVREVTDSSGATVARFDFDAWGHTLIGTGSMASTVRQRFVGALGVMLDTNTELCFMRNRWYDSATGRFVSRDPIRLDVRQAVSSNLYQYSLNRPTSVRDPLGLQASSPQDGSGAPKPTPNPRPRVTDVRLVFDGKEVVLLDAEGRPLKRWKGHSSSAMELDPGDEGVANGGPIVQGVYIVDPKSLQFQKDVGFEYGPWGPARVALKPDAFTRLKIWWLGRTGGFEIHGGIKRGTAGCIEMNTKDAGTGKWDDQSNLLDFIDWLRNWASEHPGQIIHLEVNYEGLRQ